jgi:trk system potassium uptake protein TrkA
VRVIVAGGGTVGTHVARELAAAGHEAIIVEEDPERVASATTDDEVPGVAWLQGDACEVSELMRAEPEHADVVVAVTGDDEDNLVISLLSKQEFGVARVVARVNNPDNAWLFDGSWGVDVAVSAPHLLTGLVQGAVTVGRLVELLSLGGGEVQLAEVLVGAGSEADGSTIAELDLPPDSRVVVVVRGGRASVPQGSTLVRADDELVLVVSQASERTVRARLSS